MGFENYISESEACQLAGVSVGTLKRFAETGYFRCETEQDGLLLYPRSELERVFGVAIPKTRSEPTTDYYRDEVTATASETSAPASPIAALEGASGTEESATSATLPGSSYEKFAERLSARDTLAQDQSEPVVPFCRTSVTHTVAADAPGGELAQAAPLTGSVSTETAQVSAIMTPPAPSNALQHAIEIQRLQIVTEMQEKLLLIRESEIKSLKEEREWLRTRIEKLEEKASRDQVLLLAETQTIKTLISIQEQRSSPLRTMLEWLGFVPPETRSNTQIGMNSASGSGRTTITVEKAETESKGSGSQPTTPTAGSSTLSKAA